MYSPYAYALTPSDYKSYNPNIASVNTSDYITILSDGINTTVVDPANDIISIEYQQNMNTGFGYFKVNTRASVTGQNILTSNRYFIYFDVNADGINEYLLYNTTQGDTKSVLCVWTTFGNDTRWSTRFDPSPPSYGYNDMLYNRADNDNFIEMACKLSHIGNPLDIIHAAASANPNVFPFEYNDPALDPQFTPGTVTQPGQAGSGVLIVNPVQIPYEHGTTYATVTVLDSSVVKVIFHWLSASSTVLSCSTVLLSGIGNSTTVEYRSAGIGDIGTHYCRVTFINSTSGQVGAKYRMFLVYKGNLPPEQVRLLAPENGLKTNNHSPEFIWSLAMDTDGDPVKYKLQVDNDNNFNSPEFDSAFSFNTTTTLKFWLPTDVYYWRTISQDTFNATNTSETHWFIAFDTIQSRTINMPGEYLYFLGTWDTLTEYTPITFSVISVTPGATDTVVITVYHGKHPNATDSTGQLGSTYFLPRWFNITQTGGVAKADILFYYTDQDLAAANLGLRTENDIELAKYSEGTWTWYKFPEIGHNPMENSILMFGATSFSDWTFSGPGGVPVEISRFEAEILQP
ncbi:MAG: hypothetical protein N3A72_03745 [bacterium]|nr:hypothetical protein [bacterium]